MPSSRNFVVGAFVVSGLLLFAVGLFMIGNRRKLFSDSFEIYAEFAQLGGLQNGATVRVAGMDAGEVLDIRVPPNPQSKFRVKMRVLEKLHPVVRKDSVATIQTEGVLGNKFLKIDPGTAQAPEAPSGSTLSGREPFDFADLLQQVRESVERIRGQADDVFVSIAKTSKDADELISSVSDEVQDVASSGKKISEDISVIVRGIRAGRGTVGRIFNDENLADNASKTIRDFQQTSQNLRQTSQSFSEIVSEFQDRQILEDLEEAVRNVRSVTAQGKEAIEKFQAKEGKGEAVTAELRRTVSNAREAMSDMAENMEALKHNWFFRGFFKDRGFYDLDNVTVEEYRQGKFLKKKLRHRVCVEAAQLFTETPTGSEELSDQGKERLDAAMGELIQYPRNSPIVVEGYAGKGTPEEQYLRSYDRAANARQYLVEKFHLNPNYVGIMPMGAVTANDASGQHSEGICLVLFYDKSD
jgi:phospholipid/cholesterol/gamma-HCH transport system substrate-binding protein